MFEKEAARYKDKVAFVKVNCKKHITMCRNREYKLRVWPLAELIMPKEDEDDENFLVVDFGEKDRGREGIEGFFEENGIIEKRLDSERIMKRSVM